MTVSPRYPFDSYLNALGFKQAARRTASANLHRMSI
jgi:hypothetical protein